MSTLTTAVTIKLTLYSSDAPAPYEVKGIEGTVSYNDGTPPRPLNGWTAESIGMPQPSGATLALNVADASYSSFNNVTRVGNWALTFIPRGSTRAQSPFGNNQNTISNSGAADGNGIFTLDLGNARINNTGDWDWSLIVQMILPDGTIKCFSSDPEMEVGT